MYLKQTILACLLATLSQAAMADQLTLFFFSATKFRPP